MRHGLTFPGILVAKTIKCGVRRISTFTINGLCILKNFEFGTHFMTKNRWTHLIHRNINCWTLFRNYYKLHCFDWKWKVILLVIARLNSTMELQHKFFASCVIFRGLWLLWSLNLSPPDFYLWGHLKGIVFKYKPHTLDEVKTNIEESNSNINVRQLCWKWQWISENKLMLTSIIKVNI